MKRKLNKNRCFYLIMGVILIVVVVITGLKAYNEFFKGRKGQTEVNTKVTLDALTLYGYTLDDHDTELYKKYFEELKTVLNSEEIDMEEYAKLVVQLFITDFYSLDSKVTSSDFGGVEFIEPSALENFKLNAGDTMYKHIKTDLDGKRDQELPIVSEVTISDIEEVEYTLEEEEVNAYKISAKWEYKKDLGYEKTGVFYLVEEDNKLYIVETD